MITSNKNSTISRIVTYFSNKINIYDKSFQNEKPDRAKFSIGLLPLFKVYNIRRNLSTLFYVTLAFIYRFILWRFSFSRIFQRLSQYELMGFFFIKLIIQLFLSSFGLPRCKLSLTFFGCEVNSHNGNNALARESIS